MKSKTDEIIEKAFQHAMNFFKSNDRGLDNQSLCLKQLMELTGFDFDTCLKIQNPVLSLLMAIDTMNIGQSVIENNMQMAIQGIRNHLSSLQSSKPQILDLQSVKPQISQQKFEQDFDRVDISYGIMNYTGQSITGETIQQLATLVNIRGTMQPGWGPNVFGNITEIHLANNNLSSTDLSPLYKSLYYQKINLKILDLSFNKLCSNSVGELLNSIGNKEDKQPHHIKVLKLNNNQLNDEAAEYFSWHLSSGTLPNLRCLDVSGNQITVNGGISFIEAMEARPDQEIAIKTHNTESSKGVWQFLKKAFTYYADKHHKENTEVEKAWVAVYGDDEWAVCRKYLQETGKVISAGFVAKAMKSDYKLESFIKKIPGGKLIKSAQILYQVVKEEAKDIFFTADFIKCIAVINTKSSIDIDDYTSQITGKTSDDIIFE